MRIKNLNQLIQKIRNINLIKDPLEKLNNINEFERNISEDLKEIKKILHRNIRL